MIEAKNKEESVVAAALLLACAHLAMYRGPSTPKEIRDRLHSELMDIPDDEPTTPFRLDSLALSFACEEIADRENNDAFSLERGFIDRANELF